MSGGNAPQSIVAEKPEDGDDGHDEVRAEAQAHGGAACGRSRVAGLDLAGVDLANDAPGAAIAEAKDEDSDNNEPSGHAVRMNHSSRVEAPHQEHASS